MPTDVMNLPRQLPRRHDMLNSSARLRIVSESLYDKKSARRGSLSAKLELPYLAERNRSTCGAIDIVIPIQGDIARGSVIRKRYSVIEHAVVARDIL